MLPELLGLRDDFFFLLVDEGRAFAEAFAEVGELGAADLALAFNFNLVHAR